MNLKSRNISSLIESQLPNFILEEYELFASFLKSYYEQQELSGGVLDIVSNLTTYRNINYYTKDQLIQSTKTVGATGISATTITVEDTSGFPDQGIIQIDDELILYKEKTATTFGSVSRGVSGNTEIGDLYNETKFGSTEADTHAAGSVVKNISNLFLYALIQSFEAEYLAGIPEKYLRGEIDKRTLIKYIADFYKSKGTNRSIQFIFNSLISKEKTEVFYPKDNTLKASTSDWSKVYAIRVAVLSGNPETLVGKTIIQSGESYASAVVDNVVKEQTSDGVQMWDLILAESSVNNVFTVANKTTLSKSIGSSDTVGDKIRVDSTFGWDKTGSFYINAELIRYSSKTARQFVIQERKTTQTHSVGSKVYSGNIITSGTVKLIPLGVVYNLNPRLQSPYNIEGESINVEQSGFDTVDPIIKNSNGTIRWRFPSSTDAITSGDTRTASENVDTIPGIAQIVEDDSNYYICSSGFPFGRTIFNNMSVPASDTPIDTSLLRTIRKNPEVTTEVYKTPRKDAGVFVDGVLAYTHKHEDGVLFGGLTKINVTNQGSGYTRPPFVLVNTVAYKATAILSGNVVESIRVDEVGSYTAPPVVEVVSGRNAILTPVVTSGKITSLIISNAGEYYSAPPTIRIIDNLGRGRFAEYKTRVSAVGQITEVIKVNEGNFYTAGNVTVQIIPDGSGATAKSEIFEWVKNRYATLGNSKDSENGFTFKNSEGFFNYGIVAYPPTLKSSLNDTGSNHSPIIGFAYDGNPIYGPYGYTDPVNSASALKRMESGYRIRTTRTNGPSTATYPLGSFTQDYYYADDVGDLDANNGRFCVTPEYPEGIYAYFVTEDSSQVPQYPYLFGENFYSLPLESNYKNFQTHNDLPKFGRRLRTSGLSQNGVKTRAKIKEVSSGSITGFKVFSSSDNFSPGGNVLLDNTGTSGRDAVGVITDVKGKDVSSIKATDAQKVAKIQITENCFVFNGDTITQPATGASGTAVGDTLDGKIIVLENVSGDFNSTGLFDSSTLSLNLILNSNATFTKGATLSYTDGDTVIATGEVIESTERRNSVKIKVLSGAFNITDDYYLRSDNLLNTIGAEIISKSSLSTGLVPFNVVTKAALVTTTEDHKISVGDQVDIRIDPHDNIATKTYYVQLGAIQEIDLIAPSFDTKIKDQGLGRADLVNGGQDYAANTYQDVELLFSDSNAARSNIGTAGDSGNARATIVVSDAGSGVGSVTSVTITTKGSGYRKGDVLTVADASLNRSSGSNSTQRLRLIADHIGFSSGETSLALFDVSELAINDLLQVGEEVVKVTAVATTTKIVTVERAQNSTSDIDHTNEEPVFLIDPQYNFVVGNTIAITGNASLDPRVLSYNGTKLVVEHNQSFFTSGSFSNYKVSAGSSFFDESDPKKLARISSVSDYKIVTKIASSASGPYTISPNLKFQEYYQYRFDLSHFTNQYSVFLVSPSQSDNIISPELVRQGSPGSVGAYVYVKFGYGARIGNVSLTGTLTDRVDRTYQRFYYKSYVKTTASGVKQIRIGPSTTIEDNDNYIELVTDPLQGPHEVTYVTSRRFLYEMKESPEWYGTGSMSYITKASKAFGQISKVEVQNLGIGYKKIPTLLGATVPAVNSASVTAQWDAVQQNIGGVTVTKSGKNYSNPKVVITDGDGIEADFKVVKSTDGKVLRVTVVNKGKNYTYSPKLAIVESNLRVYPESDNIGVAKNVEIEFNGSGIWNDESLIRSHTSSIALLIDTTQEFLEGEIITQGSTKGKVTKDGWRKGSNILKVLIEKGEFVKDLSVSGSASGSTGTVVGIIENPFDVDLRAYWDNLGKFTSDKGKVGIRNHKIADNNFYQDYSYVVESDSIVDTWRDLVKDSVHPAGFNVFGELNVKSSAAATMVSTPSFSQVSKLNLWNEQANSVTVDVNRRVYQTSIILKKDLSETRGFGSLSPKAFDTTAMIGRDIGLLESFNGKFDQYGILQGRRVFTLVDLKDNQPISPYNAMALTISLDGILQEPEVSYTINGNQITFAEAPFGPRTENGASIPASKFIGRLFQFRNNSKNATYLKKVRQIFQKSGTWIDAANQLRFNKDFIIDEAIKYQKLGVSTSYTSWNTLETELISDLRKVVEAYEHDLRFGGNSKTIDVATVIDADDPTVRDIKKSAIEYAKELSVAAMRNWDLSLDGCTVTEGSNVIVVPSTLGICIGMDVSSGLQFPENTTVTSINRTTREVTVSNVANINYNGLDVLTQRSETVDEDYGPVFVGPNGEWNIGVGNIITINTLIGGIDQVTFSFSRINDGTFMDAARLIEKNKEYIKQETLGWVKATYPDLEIPNEDKCARDTGYLVDAFVYHLRYGGNTNVIDFAERYFINSKLKYINNELTESIAAYNKAKQLMIAAMRNSLPAGSYTTIVPFSDSTVLADPLGSYIATCAEVESTLQTYFDIVEEILNKGPNILEKSAENVQRSGNWSSIRTYSNINILADPAGLFDECEDVASALDSLSLNSTYTIDGTTQVKSLPDYFNGENKEFELYYTDNTAVKTEEKHNLIVGINGVFQDAKYDSTFPRVNAYHIKRFSGSDPDRIVFAEAPRWEQDLNTLLVQEPLAVEKFFAHNVGLYKRLSIDSDNFNGSIKGPYTLRDEETEDVVTVDDDRFVLVFVDGVLQQRVRSYTINESTITFKQPLNKGSKVSIVLLMGEVLDQMMNAFNVESKVYRNEWTLTATTSDYTEFDQFSKYVPTEGRICYQLIGSEYKTLGTIRKLEKTSDGWKLMLTSAVNPNYSNLHPIRVAKTTDIVNSEYVEIFLIGTTTTQSFAEDNDVRILKKDSAAWLYDSNKPGVTSLEAGDLVKVDGESEFRKVKKVPTVTNPLDYRGNKDVSNSHLSTITVSNYDGIIRGEGLNVTANLTAGSVTSLTWNKRDYENGHNASATQYETPPILTFEPQDETGGGAKAQVVVDGGEVIDIVLLDGGSGYTEPPIVSVSRGYTIKRQSRITESKVVLEMKPVVKQMGSLTSISGVATKSETKFSSAAVFPSMSSSNAVQNEYQIKEDVKMIRDYTELPIKKTTYGPATSAAPGSSTTQINAQTVEKLHLTTSTTMSYGKTIRKTTQPTIVSQIAMGSTTTNVINGALLDTDYDYNDAVVMVESTAGFTATGIVQVGKYKLYYTSKASDRFVLDLSNPNNVSISAFGTVSAGASIRQA